MNFHHQIKQDQLYNSSFLDTIREMGNSQPREAPDPQHEVVLRHTYHDPRKLKAELEAMYPEGNFRVTVHPFHI